MYASILYLIFKIYYDKLSKSRRCGGMADANDSKSFGKPCGFESHHRHLMRISEKGFFFYCIGNFNEIPYAINKMLLKNIEQHLFIITNSVLILQFHPSKLRKLFLLPLPL